MKYTYEISTIDMFVKVWNDLGELVVDFGPFETIEEAQAYCDIVVGAANRGERELIPSVKTTGEDEPTE